jgi:hypothetical protein
VIYQFMPLMAKTSRQLNREEFSFRWVCIDKSGFGAKGGLRHRVHRLLGAVPHSSIDPDASWAESPCHGWRFGYGQVVLRFLVLTC